MRSFLFIGGASVALALTIFACSDDTTPDTTPDASADSSTAQPDTSVAVDASTAQDSAVSDTAVPETRGPVEILFEVVVGAKPFACGETYTNVGTTNATVTPGDMRFFVHDIKLLRGTNEVPVTLDVRDPWQSAAVGLVDFEDNNFGDGGTGECEFGTKGTNNKLTGTVLGKSFDGIAFTIGVPEALNHSNAAVQPNPLAPSSMHWGWTGGYIHFAAQLNSLTMNEGVRVPNFFTHIGSATCSGNPADGGVGSCALKNRPTVKLTGFDPTKNKIQLDLLKLYASSNLDVNTESTIPGCMSSPTDPECPAVLGKLGLDDKGVSIAPASIFASVAK